MGCFCSSEADGISGKCVFGSFDMEKCKSGCFGCDKKDVAAGEGPIEPPHQCAVIIANTVADIVSAAVSAALQKHLSPPGTPVILADAIAIQIASNFPDSAIVQDNEQASN